MNEALSTRLDGVSYMSPHISSPQRSHLQRELRVLRHTLSRAPIRTCWSVEKKKLSQCSAEILLSTCVSLQDLCPPDQLKDEDSRAALRSSAVKYLSYNRNLLPMFACPGQL